VADIIPAISGAGFKATPIGLIANKTGVTFEKWEMMGERLRLYQGAIQWAIGDWFNMGEDNFGELSAQAWNIWPEYGYDSLRKFARVARYIPFNERRPNISWSLHSEVAKLPKVDRDKWLDALEKGLTRADLRLSLNGREPKETHECPICGKVHAAL